MSYFNKIQKRHAQRKRSRARRRSQYHQCGYCSRLYAYISDDTKIFRSKKVCKQCWARFTGDTSVFCGCKSMNWAHCSEHPCTCGKYYQPRPYHLKGCVHHLPHITSFPDKGYCIPCMKEYNSKEEAEMHYDCAAYSVKFCGKCERVVSKCFC